jgi:hypothetical protein
MSSSSSDNSSNDSSSYSDDERSSSDDAPKPLPRKEYPKGYDLQNAVQNTKTRVMADVPPPYANIPTNEEFWLEKDVPNIPYIQEHLIHEGMSLHISVILFNSRKI